MDSLKLKNLALFAGGVLFGTAGVKILSSKDVKKYMWKEQQQFFEQEIV